MSDMTAIFIGKTLIGRYSIPRVGLFIHVKAHKRKSQVAAFAKGPIAAIASDCRPATPDPAGGFLILTITRDRSYTKKFEFWF
jgi:hypothetical protein